MFVMLNVNVYVEVPDGEGEPAVDPQEIANDFEGGAVSAMSHFPSGDIFQIDVESVNKLTPEQIKEHGFEEG